jgi:hypothetical protein
MPYGQNNYRTLGASPQEDCENLKVPDMRRGRVARYGSVSERKQIFETRGNSGVP